MWPHVRPDKCACRSCTVRSIRLPAPLRRSVTADPGTETARFTGKPVNAFSTASKTERSGRFRANIREGKPVIELELFHDTVSGLRSVSVGFELLSGTTLEQAKRLVDWMNERIVGVIVTSK